ncbi:MAG: HD domain-containing protein [Pseudoruegeria sp.]
MTQCSDRLRQQFDFLNQSDALKGVERSNVLLDLSRPENSAEHSWHAALFALILAPHQTSEFQLDRVLQMLLIHDLVEVDVGDHPIHLPSDHEKVAVLESNAARRLFGLLPDDQGLYLLNLWSEFEAKESADSKFAKQIDFSQPMFQVLKSPEPLPDHLEIVRDNMTSGRFAPLAHSWPEIYEHAQVLFAGDAPQSDLSRRLDFLAEADRLKSIYRATHSLKGARFENSGEHSWHIALYALILAEHAASKINLHRVIQMLLLHDIVEIDAGDAPIHGDFDVAEQESKERAAAERLFGLLPATQGAELHSIWTEFEAAQSDDAKFAKAVDRVQPLLQNIEANGGSWLNYDVSMDKMDSRIGRKVASGTPNVWAFIRPQVQDFFSKHNLD